ncbi:uncharacterized protein LOC130892706 [Diorhabda carinulata]|uniref:uncharacterized protein LOC130892706 n=1 Tax=Diorhabda carinulata TaxID=1163345 RepID=UPI0025A02E94|nr:uncharacterized protein LOC130892706 [Diorhabda carinulata]
MQKLHANKIENVQVLRISIPRLPFSDCSNVNMPQRKTSKKISTKKCLTPERTENKCIDEFSRVTKNKNIPSQKGTSTKRKNRVCIGKDKESCHNLENDSDASFNVEHNRNFQKDLYVKLHNIISNDVTHKPSSNKNANSRSQTKFDERYKKHVNKELHNKQSEEAANSTLKMLTIPLPKMLRKGTVKNYFESTLEESTNQCTPDKNKVKVPIYRQQFPILTKNNSKDPYALDIIDPKESKQKKRSSAKFNKTIYDIMKKIEKKEKKTTKKKKVTKITPSYDQKILNIMKNVLHKVNDRDSGNKKSHSSNPPLKLATNSINDSSKISFPHLDIEDGFRGFDKNETTISTLNRYDSTNLEISANKIPGSSQKNNGSPHIHVISNILLKTIKNFEFTNAANCSHSSTTYQNETNNMSITSDMNPLDKSHNLQREFHDNIPLFCEDENCESDLDNDFENVEVGCDEFFGFKDETDETPKYCRFYHKKKEHPWRFQGFFKRNPHILKLKKNGLPCKEQEMVLDYEFVQRIELLCAKKSVDTSHVKEPVQTSILDYIESAHNEQDVPNRPSLFDYEEYNVDKVPRRVLGIIQSNKVISTPTKKIEEDIRSPNVSIIRSDENEENNPLKSIRKSYQRKRGEREIRKSGDVLNEDILPSVLENNYEVPQDEVHLFEDIDQEKDTDFNIDMPIFPKKRRKRLFSEGSDDEMDEKKSKRKKKNAMTKAEENEFNAWAEKMNARFAEEDKHELTIE